MKRMESLSTVKSVRNRSVCAILCLARCALCFLLLSLSCVACAYGRECPTSAVVSHTVSLEYVSLVDEATGKLFWQLDFPEDDEGNADDLKLNQAIETPDDDLRSCVMTVLSACYGYECALGDVANLVSSDMKTPLGRLIHVDQSAEHYSVRLADGSEKLFSAGSAAPGPEQTGVTEEGVRAQIAVGFVTAGPVVEQIEIEVVTGRASRNAGQALTIQRILGEVSAGQQGADLSLESESRSIPITLRYTSDDIRGDEGGLLAALDRAAWLIFQAADEECMGLNLPEPSDAQRISIANKVRANFALPDTQNCAISVLRQQTDSETTFGYKLVVRDLPLVSDTRVVSLPYPWENDEFRKREGRAAERIARKRLDRVEKIARIYEGEMTSFRKLRVPATEGWKGLEGLCAKLAAHPDVFSCGRPETTADGDDYGVALPVLLRDPPVLTLSAGGGYSVENGLTADAAVTGVNYLHHWASFSSNLKLGAQMQRANVQGQIEQPVNSHVSAVYGLEGRFLRNDGQVLDEARFGSVEERESGFRTRIGVRYDSSSRDRSPELGTSFVSSLNSRVRCALDAAFDYRDIDLKARGLDSSDLSEGRLAALSLTGTLFLTSALGRGSNPFFKYSEMALSATTERGLDAVGGQYPYEQHHVVGSLTLFMGFAANQNDLFVRYRQGFGVSSRDTPVFRQFRLGGFETLPGLQNGEAVANNYGFRQIEIGFSLARLIPREENSPADFLPPNTFLKLFYGSARATTKRELSQLLRAGPELEGYGIGLEFRSDDQTKAITVGYAFSPDSQRHPSGTVMTGVLVFF